MDDEENEEYRNAAEPEMATAFTLVQQGAEFLLKSKIAEVSPWLLIRGEPKEWPKPKGGEDLSFSAFRTLDAHDLIRVCNTLLPSPIPDEFVTSFNKNRDTRNTIMHSVAVIETSAQDIIQYVLLVSEILIGPKKWPEKRRLFLLRDRELLFSDDGKDYVMATECHFLASVLPPSDLKRHFGYNPRNRSYFCPTCRHSQNIMPLEECRIAQIHPPRTRSNQIFCFACGDTTPVVRRTCEHCEGNVFWEDECLTCGNS